MRGPSQGHTHVKGNILRLGGLLCMVFVTSGPDVGLGVSRSTSMGSVQGFPGPSGKADVLLSGLQNSKVVLVTQGVEPHPLPHAYLLPTLHRHDLSWMLSPLLRVQHFHSRATLPNSHTRVDHILSDHAFHSVQRISPRTKFTTYSWSGLCFYPGTRWPQRTSQGAANALRLQRIRVANSACASLSRNCIGVSRSWTEVTKIMLDQAFVRTEFQFLLKRGQARHSEYTLERNACSGFTLYEVTESQLPPPHTRLHVNQGRSRLHPYLLLSGQESTKGRAWSICSQVSVAILDSFGSRELTQTDLPFQPRDLKRTCRNSVYGGS
ncbi:hypothetical protein VNO77_19053 [Canavalia gladiata]|uniref:Uncharacterized protein n=1 Tax=Canavalia gladiata TaxID=3824 RepID=A0AAN9LQN6_CANGL